jgi:hypothetical protein
MRASDLTASHIGFEQLELRPYVHKPVDERHVEAAEWPACAQLSSPWAALLTVRRAF